MNYLEKYRKDEYKYSVLIVADRKPSLLSVLGKNLAIPSNALSTHVSANLYFI